MMRCVQFYGILQRRYFPVVTPLSFHTRSRAGFDDYTRGREEFKLSVPKYYNFAKHVFDAWTSKQPENTALWWVDDNGISKRYSYRQLTDLSKRMANGLLKGAKQHRGDRVIVMLPRLPEWWILSLACMRTGIVLCPGTTLLTQKDIDWRLTTCCATAIIVDKENMHKVDEVSENHPQLTKICVTDAECPDDWLNLEHLMSRGSPEHECADTLSADAMSLFFTSGTTGSPKMVQHSHASYGIGHAITGRYWLDLSERDVMWSNSDTGWAKTAYSTLGPWSMGATVFTHHTAKFDPEITLKMLADYPITTFCTVPTAYRFLVQERLQDYKMKALSHSVSAAEPLNPEVFEAWLSGTGTVIKEGYGQTETVLVCSNYKCIETKPGSMGKPAPGFDIKIVDDNGVELPPHTEGNLAISISPERPVGLFSGYVGDDDRTRSVFVNGTYITGDRAYQDEQGYIWFVGRADDVILSAGYRIGPFEVESALQEHPAVLESAVVSSPDELRGEVVKAFVVLTEQAKLGDIESLKTQLQNHVKSITAPYKYPRKIEFTELLPKTVSGKTRRVELRDKEWQQSAT